MLVEDENAKKRLERAHADNREQAKAAWLNADNSVLKSTELAAQLGTQALRAPGFLNAAGTAALLGLVSANARLLKAAEGIVAFTFLMFILGATASAVSLGVAYFAQRRWVHEQNDHTKSANHPYVTRNKRSNRLTGDSLFAIAIGGAVFSFLAFGCGAWSMLRVVRQIALAP